MEIDVLIERIDNGYIVTSNDSTKSKHYYGSLKDFVEARITEGLMESDAEIRCHATPSSPFFFRLTTDL